MLAISGFERQIQIWDRDYALWAELHIAYASSILPKSFENFIV